MWLQIEHGEQRLDEQGLLGLKLMVQVEAWLWGPHHDGRMLRARVEMEQLLARQRHLGAQIAKWADVELAEGPQGLHCMQPCLQELAGQWQEQERLGPWQVLHELTGAGPKNLRLELHQTSG